MNYKIVLLALFSGVLLAACGTSSENTDDVRTLIDEYSAGNFTDNHNVSESSSDLIITNEDDSQETYDLPEDDFFVSIAPFENQTHACDIHSLTGCQGELVDADFNLLIKNEAGEVVIDETKNSGAIGFIDLWLPRDDTYDVKIEYDGKKVASVISTYDGDNTCITTMQLF